MKSINEIVLFLDPKILKNKGGIYTGGISGVIPTDLLFSNIKHACASIQTIRKPYETIISSREAQIA